MSYRQRHSSNLIQPYIRKYKGLTLPLLFPQESRAFPGHRDGALRRLRHRLPEEDTHQGVCAVSGGDPCHRGAPGHDHHGALSRRRLLQDHHQLPHHCWRGERRQWGKPKRLNFTARTIFVRTIKIKCVFTVY